VPVSEYRYRRRVQFADTDQAGVVHFSWIVKYMEEAEHALWREAGLTIAPADGIVAYPRVALSVDFAAPLHFEEEFEVHIRIEAISRRTIRYAHTIRRGDTVIATGTMTAASVCKVPAPMRSIEIPAEVLERLVLHMKA
jgi:YbgC/YbaW family acyl-CoA thioester hydrolase